jgi:hypothetical protein
MQYGMESNLDNKTSTNLFLPNSEKSKKAVSFRDFEN